MMNSITKIVLHRIQKSKEAMNAIWIISGRIIQMIIAFIVGILSARYLGPSNYGLINYGTTFITFFTAFSTLGINSIIIKELIDFPDEQGKTIGTTLVVKLIASFLSILMIFGIVMILDHDEPLTIAVSAICSIALIFQIFDTFNYWFQSKYQSKISSIASLIAYVVTSIYKIFLLAFQKSVQWFAFATVLDYIIIAILLYVFYKKNNGLPLSFSKKKGIELLKKSYHYILSGMMVAIYGQTDKLMLKQMLDETSVGYYSLASTINFMWVFVLQAIIDSMYPTILQAAKKSKEEFERKNKQLYAIVIYVSGFVAILFQFWGKFIVCLLYGKEYEPAVAPLRIVTWYTIFSYLGVARNIWIVSEGKQKYLKYMYFSAAMLNIILNYLFIPRWGAVGAAWASLITQIFTSIVIPMFIKDMRSNVKLMLEAFILKDVKLKKTL